MNCYVLWLDWEGKQKKCVPFMLKGSHMQSSIYCSSSCHTALITPCLAEKASWRLKIHFSIQLLLVSMEHVSSGSAETSRLPRGLPGRFGPARASCNFCYCFYRQQFCTGKCSSSPELPDRLLFRWLLWTHRIPAGPNYAKRMRLQIPLWQQYRRGENWANQPSFGEQIRAEIGDPVVQEIR